MLDLRNCEYFYSLPVLIQETIMQTGLEFKNEEELRQFASEYDNDEE